MCHFVLVFLVLLVLRLPIILFLCFSVLLVLRLPRLGNLSAFRTFVRFVLVWICRFPLPLGVWEGLRFVIVALPGLFLLPFLELPHNCYELGRTAKLRHNFPKNLTTDCIKCFGKFNKGHVEVHVLFLTLLLKLSCYEDHVSLV